MHAVLSQRLHQLGMPFHACICRAGIVSAACTRPGGCVPLPGFKLLQWTLHYRDRIHIVV